MSTGKRLIQIYIHPDSGPITPMTLDLDAVEVAINKVPSAHSADEAAVREIVRQIRAKFKELEPENSRRQLALIMRRWVNAEGFNGMVIRLSGNIPSREMETTAANRSSLEELSRLTKAFESEKRVSATLNLRVQGLETENKRLRTLYERVNSELIDKRIQEQQQQAGTRQQQSTLKQALNDADRAMQEVETLKIRIEQLQKQSRSQEHYEQELAQLRQKERSARQSEQQIRETLEKLQRDYMFLQEEHRRLVEGSLFEEVEAETSDPYAL